MCCHEFVHLVNEAGEMVVHQLSRVFCVSAQHCLGDVGVLMDAFRVAMMCFQDHVESCFDEVHVFVQCDVEHRADQGIARVLGDLPVEGECGVPRDGAIDGGLDSVAVHQV